MKCLARSFLVVLAMFMACGSAPAALFRIAISPAGGALNLGANPFVQDHAVGLSALNENHQPGSNASGNVLGGGIAFDDATEQLTFDFGYGSDFGFNDLLGDFSAVHIHGNDDLGLVNFPAVNGNSGVAHNLAAFHTAGSSARTGRIAGMVTLSAAEATRLFDNALYFNIHSGFSGAGEIRGQLVAVPEPSGIAFAAAMMAAGFFVVRRRRKAADAQTV